MKFSFVGNQCLQGERFDCREQAAAVLFVSLEQQAKSKNFVEEEKRILRQGAGGYDK